MQYLLINVGKAIHLFYLIEKVDPQVPPSVCIECQICVLRSAARRPVWTMERFSHHGGFAIPAEKITKPRLLFSEGKWIVANDAINP